MAQLTPQPTVEHGRKAPEAEFAKLSDGAVLVGHSIGAIPQAVMHRPAGRDHQLNNDLADVAPGIAALPR